MQNVQLAARKRGDKWAGALVIDGEFQDSFVKDSLTSLTDQSLLPLLATIDGDLVTITIHVTKAK